MRKAAAAGIMTAMIITTIGIGYGEVGMVSQGKTVKIHYTLTVNGEVIDSSSGKEPLEYVQGEGMIIPGLERQLAGMAVGEKKSVVVGAQEAYGEKDARAVIEVPKDQFAQGGEPQTGMMIQVPTQSGEPLVGVVESVGEETLVLDFNHPLAGKELHFDVEIVEVK